MPLNVVLALWTVYLALAPVYWLPGVPLSLFLSFKTALIAAASVASVLRIGFDEQARMPVGWRGLLGFAVILSLALPGFVSGNLGANRQLTLNLAYAAIVFVAFAGLAGSGPRPVTALVLAALAMAAFNAYVIAASMGLAPDYRSPAVYQRLPVSISGFTGLRTGWSNGSSLYVAPLVVFGLLTQNKLFKLLCVVGVAAIFGGQLVVGGRGGLLASLLAVGLAILWSQSRGIKWAATPLVVAALAYLLPDFYQHLRFDRIDEELTFDSLNSFSAGRIGSYLYALDIFVRHPFTGVGFGNSDVGGHSIHNLWLKHLADAGLLFVVGTLAMIGTVVARAFRFRKIGGGAEVPALAALLIVVLQGLLISMFEPNVILGSFQNTALWWAALGYLSGRVDCSESEVIADPSNHESPMAAQIEAPPVKLNFVKTLR